MILVSVGQPTIVHDGQFAVNLTSIVNEFVKKIIVHAPDKSSGHRRQTIEIVFNFVGKVEIPILTEPVILERVSTQKKTA